MFDLVLAQELQARILLGMNRPEDALVCADAGIKVATEMNYTPMLRRFQAAKAQAIGMLGDEERAGRQEGR